MTSTHRVTHISFPDMEETSYHDITSGIAEGSLLLDEILLTNGLNFGEVNSNRFEVQLYNISDVSGQKIVVWQEDLDTSTNIPLFTGYVDSCKQNKAGYYREIIAYDIFYKKGNENISSWWGDYWDEVETTTTLKDLRDALLEYMEIATVTLPVAGYANDGLTIKKLQYEPTLTFGSLLTMICQLQGTIPNINRSGYLEFVTLGTTSVDESSNINTRDSMFEEFNTEAVDAVWIYDSDYNVIGIGGAGTQNAYRIYGNILINGVSLVDTAATTLYQAIGNLSYTPADIVYIVSDPELTLGKHVNFGSGYTYLFENTLSGPILIEQESKAQGAKYLVEDSNWNSDISGLQDKVSNAEIRYYLFTNANQIVVADGEIKRVIDIRFSSNKPTLALFQAELLVVVETTAVTDTSYGDAVCTVKYRYNEYINSYQPKETWFDGNHILHLLYTVEMMVANVYRLEVFLEMAGGTITIPAERIKASLYGQNLAAAEVLPQDVFTENQKNLENWTLTGELVVSFEDDVNTITFNNMEESRTDRMTRECQELYGAYIMGGQWLSRWNARILEHWAEYSDRHLVMGAQGDIPVSVTDSVFLYQAHGNNFTIVNGEATIYPTANVSSLYVHGATVWTPSDLPDNVGSAGSISSAIGPLNSGHDFGLYEDYGHKTYKLTLSGFTIVEGKRYELVFDYRTSTGFSYISGTTSSVTVVSGANSASALLTNTASVLTTEYRLEFTAGASMVTVILDFSNMVKTTMSEDIILEISNMSLLTVV